MSLTCGYSSYYPCKWNFQQGAQFYMCPNHKTFYCSEHESSCCKCQKNQVVFRNRRSRTLTADEKDTTCSHYFIKSADAITIKQTINKLTPISEACGCRKIKICLQKICQKSPLFCGDCQAKQHLTHRTNDISLLSVNRKNYGAYYGAEKKSELRSLKIFIQQQRDRCSDIIREQTELADLLNENILQLQAILKQAEYNSWQEQFDQCIQGFLSKRISVKQARETFEQCLKKVNLFCKSQPTTLLKTQKFLLDFQKSQLRKAEANYGKNFYDRINILIELEKKGSVEKLLRETPIQHFVASTRTGVELALTNLPGRARQVNLNTIDSANFVSRLFISKAEKTDQIHKRGLSICQQLPHLNELHTPYHFSSYPPNLRALTIDFGFYEKNISNCTLKTLPKTIRTLRIKFSEINGFTTYLKKDSSLEYLVIYYPNVTPAFCKPWISLSRTVRQMRVLCLIRSPPKKNYSKIGNWEHRFESSDDHYFPQLRRHYLAYQQRMQQISAMEKTLLSRLHNSSRLSVLSAVISSIEFDLESQFDK